MHGLFAVILKQLIELLGYKMEKSVQFWCMLAAVCGSNFLCGALTYGGVALLTHIWSDKFSLRPDVAAWAASINGGAFMLTGKSLVVHGIGLIATTIFRRGSLKNTWSNS